MRALALAILLAVPTAAAASPREGAVGVSLGWLHPHDAPDGESPSVLGLWGRLRLSPRLAGQLELGRVRGDDDGCGGCDSPSATGFRTGTALLVVDLAERGPWMPILYVGAGLDRDDREGDLRTEGHHFEGGFGVEYRADGGLVLGADARMGGRSIDSEPDMILSADGSIAIVPFAPSGLRAGEYRAVRFTLGLKF